MHDVIVVGGSYAGMSAALQLVRARRRVLVVDGGQRRNRAAAHAHGFLGSDGEDPGEIAARGREQLAAYPTLDWIERQARAARGGPDAFEVTLSDGATLAARRLILATGVTDDLPDVPGLAERWGGSVFHCPYCHAYELGGAPAGVLGIGAASLHQALMMPDWGPTTFLVNGALTLDANDRARLAARGVTVEEVPVRQITGHADVELADGRRLSFAGLLTGTRVAPASPLAASLGCGMVETPLGQAIAVDARQQTEAPGVAACGDAARAMHSVALAVADGAVAGAMTHQGLMAAG